MSEGALPDPTTAILAIPQTQEVANLFSLTAVVVSSDRRHAMFPLSGVDSVPPVDVKFLQAAHEVITNP